LPTCTWEYLLSLIKGLEIGPLFGTPQSLPTCRECKPAGYLHRGHGPAWRRGADVPGKSGSFRAAVGRGRVDYLNPAVRARMMAWARSET
jgi:hypothetical protein